MASTANYNLIADSLRDYGYSWREVNKYITDVENDFDLFRTKEEKMQQQLMAQQGITRATIALKLLADGFSGTAEELGALVEQELINQQKAAYYAEGQDMVSTAYGDRQEAAIKAAAAAEMLGSADDVLVTKIYDQVTAIDFLIEKSNEFSETADILAIRQEESAKRTELIEEAIRKAGGEMNLSKQEAEDLLIQLGLLNGLKVEASVEVDTGAAREELERIKNQMLALMNLKETKGGTDSHTKDTHLPKNNAAGVSNFVVPPGFPGDSYMMGVTSGEVVNVASNGGGGGAGNVVNIYVNGMGRGGMQVGQQVATAVTDALGRLN